MNEPGMELPEARPTHVVGIGASAGGVEALERFVEALPLDTGMAFVVVQHLAPDFQSMMDQLLGRRTRLPVVTVRSDMRLRANCIHLLPEGKELIIAGEELQLVDPVPGGPRHLPIDRFFLSLAEHWEQRAMAVVLSGTGSDGSTGARAIYDHGGVVIAQTADSAGFDSMPNNAVATGAVSQMLRPEQIPAALVRARDPLRQDLPPRSPATDPLYGRVFTLLRRDFGIDFSAYKIDTVARRIERRMSDAGMADTVAYAAHLEAHPEDLNRLYRDLLIGVTGFFRDPPAWEFLEQTVLPRLFALAEEEGDLRIWTAGCATGEEVYSLAMLIREHMGQGNQHLPVKIFATDVHQQSLDFAANGIYDETQVHGIPQARLEQHFSRVEQGYLIKPELRKMVVFAHQDVTRDPPFTKMSMISCRNMLIYLNAEAQQKVLGMFHFALVRKGFLFLGGSEGLGGLVNEFNTESSRFKVFSKRTDRRIAGASFRVPSIRPPLPPEERGAATAFTRGTLSGRPISLIRAYDVLMEEYMPPSILVSASGEIAHTFGDARRYLRPQSGVATLYLSELVLPELRLAVVSALQKVQSGGERLLYSGLRVPPVEDDGEERINLHVRPLGRPESRDAPYTLLSFEKLSADRPPVEETVEVDFRSVPEDRMRDLETELRYTKEHLQTAVEDLETSNEELQATNEELMAANEELQSTNEELHSVNQELYTVNREYEAKIDELTVLTSDMDNMLKSTGLGTLFLDRELRIRKYTPAAAQQFSLLEQDVGRPLVHLNQHIDFPDLQHQLERVLATEESYEREVRDRFGVMLLMRITPYRDADERVSGVVVTFVNVDRLISSSRELQRSHEQLQDFAYAVSHALLEPVRIAGTACRELGVELGGRLSAEQQELLTAATDAADRSVHMTRALLEYSRVESRGLPPAPTDSEAACREAIASLRERIQATGARIELAELPRVMVDAGQLVQVFRHLLENAITFSRPPARIQVSCHRQGRVAAFTVRDEGLGMSAQAVEHAFDVFGMKSSPGAADSAERGSSGLGLGLAVCKRIVERNGGNIWIDSRLDQGTRVNFTLPTV